MTEGFTVQHQVVLPEGALLRAKLKELEVRSIPKRDGSGSFNKLKWKFEITQAGEYLGLNATAETSAYLTDEPDNVFRQWAEALLNRPLDLGVTLYPQDLEGLPCLVEIGKEQDRKDSTKFWRRVVTVIPTGEAAQSEEPPF